MEYVDGETLAALVERSETPRDVLLRYAREAAGGIIAAHASGIVHRDLKPNNIMVSQAGTVKVLDFGLARRGATASLRPADGDTVSITALGRENR